MEEVYYLKLLIAVVGLGTALVTSAFNYILYDRQSRDIERALKGVQEELHALKADISKGYATVKGDAAGAVDVLKELKGKAATLRAGKGLQE